MCRDDSDDNDDSRQKRRIRVSFGHEHVVTPHPAVGSRDDKSELWRKATDDISANIAK